MRTHSDPTAAEATGNLQKEWIDLAALAIKMRHSKNRAWIEAQESSFTGIFRRFLTESEEELLEEIPPRERKKRGL